MQHRTIAKQLTRRGAGLGNEIIAFAKSRLAAQALGGKDLGPAWFVNRYNLADQLGLSRARMALAQAAMCAPHQQISAEAYRATGVHGYGRAMQILRAGGELRRPLSVHHGMWGGYLAIAEAKDPITNLFLRSPGVEKFLKEHRRPDGPLQVGIHVRRGDFGAGRVERGKWNTAVPLDWYGRVISEIATQVADVEFIVCSDGREADLQPLLELGAAVRIVRGSGASAPVQELTLLASCAALVCSVSSFSMLAAFLSDRPYVWFEPQLLAEGSDRFLWADRDATRVGGAGAGPSGGKSRVVLAGADGALNADLLSVLQAGRFDRHADLIYYGRVSRDA